MEPTTVKNLHDRAIPANTQRQPITLDERYSTYLGQEDEISLIDLWLILVKRKVLITAIILCAVLLGIAWAWYKPANYVYTTTIEIGKTIATTGNGPESRLTEVPDTALAKLTNGYIPEVLNRYVAKHRGPLNRYKVDANIPKDSNVIVLKSSGSAQDRAVYDAIHSSIVASLAADEVPQLSTTRNQLNTLLAKAGIELQHLKDPSAMTDGQGELEAKLGDLKSKLAEVNDPQLRAVPISKLTSQLEAAKDKMAQLKDDEKLLKLDYKHLDDTDQLLQARVAELQSHIKASLQQRSEAVKSIKGESQAMTLLMLNSELQTNRNDLANIQERRKVNLVTQREKLGKELDDNRRAQQQQSQQISDIKTQLTSLNADTEQKGAYYNEQIRVLDKQLADLKTSREASVATKEQEIISLRSQLDMLKPTHAIATPEQTAEPTGPGKMIIVALAIILGIFAALLSAFIAEFLHKARHAARAVGTT